MRILIDMDECLVDFVAGAARLWGLSTQELDAKRTPGVWDITGPLGVTYEEFWAKIHEGGTDFWERLDSLPWFWNMIKLVEKYTKDWHIISSPSEEECSYTGKVRWLKRVMGRSFSNFALTPHKQIFANNFTVLIDDREENCLKFREAGGYAIVFPNIGNSLYNKRANPLSYVRNQLAMLAREIEVIQSTKEPPRNAPQI